MTLTLYSSEAKQDIKQPISCMLYPLQSCAVVSCMLNVHIPVSTLLKHTLNTFNTAAGPRGNYCMLLVSSTQGESSTRARLKCCQSLNGPQGLGLERKTFVVLWKQKRQNKQYYAVISGAIVFF